MRILAVDPSSTRCGVAILENNFAKQISCWTRNKKDDLGAGLYDFSKFLQNTKAKQKIDIVAVERMALSRNVKTVRMVSYFESVALAKGGEWGVPTFLIEVTSARKKALGKGNITKEQVYDKLSKTYNLLPFNTGGSDQADAIVVGIAAYNTHK